MNQIPFFSVVIPVYKNVLFLKRLLDSLDTQTFHDYEVIITDDSPDSVVEDWLNENYQFEKMSYFRNPFALGTPENWNEGIRRSKGEWIKIMHDDDWFAFDNSLELMHAFILGAPSARFIFSGYSNYFFDTKNHQVVRSPLIRRRLLKSSPFILYSRNIIGPPSVTIIHSSISVFYDRQMKWLVDIDYYINLLAKNEAHYIDQPLINVGIGIEQVTTNCHTVAEVEIPEGILLLSKIKDKHPWRNVLYFDAWWRLIRNLGIRNRDSFLRFTSIKNEIKFILRIIDWQMNLNPRLLRNGYFSKSIMFLCWLRTIIKD